METTNHITVRLKVGEVEVDDSMVVNIEDYIPAGEHNPYKVRPFIIGHEFGAICIVFADCAQDTLDIAADNGNLDCFLIPTDRLLEMNDKQEADVLYLGNESKAYNDDYMWMDELPNPKLSFITLLEKHLEENL